MSNTTANGLADLVNLFGGNATGKETKAALVEQLKDVAPQGGTPSEQAMADAIESYLAANAGELDATDFDEIFG